MCDIPFSFLKKSPAMCSHPSDLKMGISDHALSHQAPVRSLEGLPLQYPVNQFRDFPRCAVGVCPAGVSGTHMTGRLQPSSLWLWAVHHRAPPPLHQEGRSSSGQGAGCTWAAEGTPGTRVHPCREEVICLGLPSHPPVAEPGSEARPLSPGCVCPS